MPDSKKDTTKPVYAMRIVCVDRDYGQMTHLVVV